MKNKNSGTIKQLFCPLSSVTYVSEKTFIEIPKNSISVKKIGHKAFGLTCLPKPWTLPFICISSDLLSNYNLCKKKSDKASLIKHWVVQIKKAAISNNIKETAPIIIRSSGCSESLEERGRYYSRVGTIDSLFDDLTACLEQLSSDTDLKGQTIPLIIQKYLTPNHAKGHLSNERRLRKDTRDWVVAYEEIDSKPSIQSSTISLRNWRKKINVQNDINQSLNCELSPHIAEVLKIPAAWIYELKTRVHFEWSWDGNTVMIVQADIEHESYGVNPTVINKTNRILSKDFIPQCLKVISQNDIQYNKIKNVFTYLKLGLIEKTNLYILDDQKIIENLAIGEKVNLLKKDLQELIKDSLVIRMDVETDDLSKRQLLPRTDEVREINEAIDWLRKASKERAHTSQEKIVFIFHNFIPAVSSAFAYAAPRERNVQIESLWGVPEGLYYNSHDKYTIDTKRPNIKEIHTKDIDSFTVSAKCNSKQFIITPDENGFWTSKIIKPSFFWRKSIESDNWVKQIAFDSRLIAEEVGKPLSIMWFIGIPPEINSRPILPWYHEVFDSEIMNRTLTHRRKTPFHKSFSIRKIADLEKLKEELKKNRSLVRQIKIQPSEHTLIRNKETLKIIGEIANKIDAVILLEGGILSHAYYQLMKTNAMVEIVHPFSSVEGKRKFNKLVRDKVPEKISYGGETVRKTCLTGEHLLKALKEKLIEESMEVLDAIDKDQIVDELADVNEVIDSIVSQLNHAKIKKIDHNNNGPIANTKKLIKNNSKIIPQNNRIDVKDKKTTFEFEIPISNKSWVISFPKEQIKINSDSNIQIDGEIKGKYIGSKLAITFSIVFLETLLNEKEINLRVISPDSLVQENLLKTLKENLFQQSFKVLDAVNQNQIVNELANINETINSILSQLGITKNALITCQNRKRAKAGGFKKGLVLIETKNPLPQKQKNETHTLFNYLSGTNSKIVAPKVPKIIKRSDKRIYKDKEEIILTVEAPIVKNFWEADFVKIKTKIGPDHNANINIKIKGERIESALTITFSVCIQDIQLSLFPFSDS